MTRRRCDFFFDCRIILFESPYGSRMGFRMGVAWDFTEQEEAARSCRTSATAQSERTNSNSS